MANKQLFKNLNSFPITDTVNEANGTAYLMSDAHALAQYACTGTFANSYYASEEKQLERLLELCKKVDPEFIAKTAIYARKYGYMKDAPAFLLAYLCANANKDEKSQLLFKKAFYPVCDNIKMLRNFIQIIRSGITGRRSFGTMPKRMIAEWLNSKSADNLFRMSIGRDPSFLDIINMVHPKPATNDHDALYAYFLGRDFDIKDLPPIVRQFEMFKKDTNNELPKVSFEMLTSLPLSNKQWKEIAWNASWTQTRMNLNTFARKGIFDDDKLTRAIAARLVNKEEIARANVFPYQLMAAYINANMLPGIITNALQDAMEIAVENVPKIDGKIFVFPDVSISMQDPITGKRHDHSSKMKFVHISALVAASFLRMNPNAVVIPFSDELHEAALNPKDSIMTNAHKLSRLPGKKTDLSLPMARINEDGEKGDLVVYISDNESFIDTALAEDFDHKYSAARRARATRTMDQWKIFQKANPAAKIVAIDVAPLNSTQLPSMKNVLNVGGFSDNVFKVISAFVDERAADGDFWVKEIEKRFEKE